jgi:hypothetical protein
MWLANACFIGLWLGVLTRENLHALDKEYYTRSKRRSLDKENYHSREWNHGGLFAWEKSILADYFMNCRRLLVIGAGGGREILALRQLGYQVDGFESHPDLVTVANELLREQGYDSAVRLIPRDSGPRTQTTYDGIIIGWATYTLVQGRKHRIALLKQLRAQTQAQCPIVLSFFWRARTHWSYRVASFVANMIRRQLRREPTEIGDWLTPNYVHHFIQDEITSELLEGGFDTIHYSTTGYGHAVGIAVP